MSDRSVKDLKDRCETLERDFKEFTDSVSQNFSAPLRKIRESNENLASKVKDQGEGGMHCVNIIQNSVEICEKMLEGLLRVSGVYTTQEQPEKVNLLALMSKLKESIQKFDKGKGIKVVYSNLPEVYGYSNLLFALFYNLTDNSMKFQSSYIEISCRKEDGSWLFSVKDDGMGVSEDGIDIFAPFEKIVESEGVGIGLTLCKAIVKKHNGKIWFEKNVDKGAIFYFTLGDVELEKKNES